MEKKLPVQEADRHEGISRIEDDPWMGLSV
jgi:hypothetical protein